VAAPDGIFAMLKFTVQYVPTDVVLSREGDAEGLGGAGGVVAVFAGVGACATPNSFRIQFMCALHVSSCIAEQVIEQNCISPRPLKGGASVSDSNWQGSCKSFFKNIP
jgi:hypothetical protein